MPILDNLLLTLLASSASASDLEFEVDDVWVVGLPGSITIDLDETTISAPSVTLTVKEPSVALRRVVAEWGQFDPSLVPAGTFYDPADPFDPNQSYGSLEDAAIEQFAQACLANDALEPDPNGFYGNFYGTYDQGLAALCDQASASQEVDVGLQVKDGLYQGTFTPTVAEAHTAQVSIEGNVDGSIVELQASRTFTPTEVPVDAIQSSVIDGTTTFTFTPVDADGQPTGALHQGRFFVRLVNGQILTAVDNLDGSYSVVVPGTNVPVPSLFFTPTQPSIARVSYSSDPESLQALPLPVFHPDIDNDPDFFLVYEGDSAADCIVGDLEVRLADRAFTSGIIASGDRVELGADASSGEVRAVGAVSLRNRATVNGNVTAGGTLSMQQGASVTGTVDQNASDVTVQLPGASSTFAAADFVGNVVVNSGKTHVLTPGAYGNVTVNGNGRLVLDGVGEYGFNRLTVNSGAVLSYDEGSSLTLQRTITWRGIQDGTGPLPVTQLLGGWSHFETPYEGAIVAPKAKLRLQGNGNPVFVGEQFVGLRVFVEPGVEVSCDDPSEEL